MSAYPNHTKRLLRASRLALGLVLRQARTADTPAIAKACGYDWMSIDMEHGTLGLDTAAQMAVAALALGITALVRVPGKEHYHASRLLDAGAQGVIVPHVETADEARQIISQCKFPPLGERSFASVQPQLGFLRLPGGGEAQAIDDEILIVAMLESSKAIDNAEAIAAVPGIDVLLVGTNDLCAEMGIPDQVTHPRIQDAYRRVIAACRLHGANAGMAGLHDPDLTRTLIAEGVRFVTGGTDLGFLMQGARQRASFLRGLQPV